MRVPFILAVGYALVLAGMAASARAGTVTPTPGYDTFGPGVPTASSSRTNPYVLVIYYFAPDGTLASKRVRVTNIVAAPTNPTPAQAAAASAAKAKAIADAINAAKIPGVTASVNAATQPGQYATGGSVIDPKTGLRVAQTAPYQQSFYTVNGTRDSVWEGPQIVEGAVSNKGKTSYTGPNAKLGPGVYKLRDPTKENGNGQRGRNKKGGTPKSMNQGIDKGTGSTSGFSTGHDPSGDDSVIGFGFIDDTTATPVDYLAAFYPNAGLTDAQALGDLATLFNEDYSAEGYTATYSPVTDTLSIDQLLPQADTLWDTDTDTGLRFTATLLEVTTPTPTAATAGLVLLALLGLAAGYRRLSNASSTATSPPAKKS